MRRIALLSAIVLAVAIVAAVSLGGQPSGSASTSPRAGQATAVTSLTRTCPPAAPGSGKGTVTMISVPAAGSGETGAATLSALPATAESGETASASAKPVTAGRLNEPVTVAEPGTGAAALTVSGRLAEGFEAEEANASGTGLVSCAHPSSDLWFTGAGQSDGAPVIRLYLMNAGSIPASVNVTILTDSGLQSGLSGTITVGPGQLVTENVARYVAGSQALGLHVQASSGQVAAAVWEGNAGHGASQDSGAWLPQAAAPSATLVIPGLTVASSAARLFVTVPGSADAKLTVVAYTASGAVTQYLGTDTGASAGATTQLSLSSLGSSVTGLKVTSSVPVVASVLVPGAGLGAFTTATAPVQEQGVVAGNPAAKGVTVGLLLTAPAAAARVKVTVLSAEPGNTAQGQEVTVAAHHSLAVTVPRPTGKRQPFAIVLTPLAGSGPLYAARAVTAGPGGLSAPVAALLPLASALTSIVLPPVQDAYTAVLP